MLPTNQNSCQVIWEKSWEIFGAPSTSPADIKLHVHVSDVGEVSYVYVFIDFLFAKLTSCIIERAV